MGSILYDMTNEEYHGFSGVSKSKLDLINLSPSLVEWSNNAPGDGSVAADLGTMLHSILLEPEKFDDEYAYTPDFENNAKGKRDRGEFEAAMSDKKLIPHNVYAKLLAMKNSVLAHPVARELLTSTGVSEASIFSNINGVRVKCRPDRIYGATKEQLVNREKSRVTLVDLKKTDDMDFVARSFRKYRYYVQDAFYSDIYKSVFGVAPRFVFIVVAEKRSLGKHPVRVFEIDAESVERGRSEYIDNLEAFDELDQFGGGMDIEELRL